MKKTKQVTELCGFCNEEVALDAELTLQECPNCGMPIIPCSLCNFDKCDCENCSLRKHSEKRSESHITKAIRKIKKEVSKTVIKIAYLKMSECRYPLYYADRELHDTIYDLLEEYGEDNDLGEGWWMYSGDIEDIFKKIL